MEEKSNNLDHDNDQVENKETLPETFIPIEDGKPCSYILNTKILTNSFVIERLKKVFDLIESNEIKQAKKILIEIIETILIVILILV